MATLSELLSRLQDFEATQKRMQAEQEELKGLVEMMRKELASVRGISDQLKQYFDTVSNQNKQLLSPKSSQNEVTINDVLKVIKELQNDG
jgi:Mg2+/Co2+ transporter CorB